LQVTEWDVSQPRAVARCLAGKPLEIRPFWGWNRATHSLLELAVLWSRRNLLDAVILKEEFQRHRIIIEKTAGDRELTALSLLDEQFKNRFEQN
jgi:hypothetical protein